MRNHAVRILVNGIILVASWTGLMIMDTMAQEEDAARYSVSVDAYDKANEDAATEMVRTQLDAMKSKFDRCTEEPFLTDHVLISGSELGGSLYTGVVYDVTLDKALSIADKYVLAYCE